MMGALNFGALLLTSSPAFGAGPDLTFGRMQKTYRLGSRVAIVVRNHRAREIDGVILLETPRIDGSYDGVLNITDRPGQKIAQGLYVPGNGRLLLKWSPARSVPKGAIRPGRTYRLVFTTVDALEGGGAVYYSSNFKIVRH